MAMSAAITWEFRATATANMVNGGGFKTGASGINKSLQDTAYLNGTDGETKNGVYTRLYSTEKDFNDAALPGNVIHITAGTNFTPGWYEIIAVGTDGDGDYIDIDRNCATGNSNNATFYIGGALGLNSTLDDDFFEQCVPGQTIYIKYGTYDIGEDLYVVAAGTFAAPISIIGYKLNRNDSPTGEDRPTIQCTPFTPRTFTIVGQSWILKHIIFTGNYSDVVYIGSFSIIENCKATNSSAAADKLAIRVAGYGSIAINCEGISTAGRAFYLGQYGACAYGCYAHDSKTGLEFGTLYGAFINCISAYCTTAVQGTSAADRCILSGCTLYGNETPVGTGIDVGAGDGMRIYNCIIYGFEIGITSASQNGEQIDYCCLYNNTTPYSTVVIGSHCIASDPQFVDAPNGNFRLSSGSPALGVGAGSSFPTLSGSYAVNIGADQGDHTDLPSAADVRDGVSYGDAQEGTLDLPAIADVRDGVKFDGESQEGILDLPALADVRDGVTFDNLSKEGTLDLPAVEDVRDGTKFDNETKEGTLDLPSEDDVRDAVKFDNGTKEGNLELPSIGEVAAGIGFGTNGTEFVGEASLLVVEEADVPHLKIYASDGNTLVYVVPLLQTINLPHEEKKSFVVEALRGQGGLIIPGSDAIWDLVANFILIGDNYASISAKIQDLESAVLLHTPYVVTFEKNNIAEYSYNVMRVDAFEYQDSFRVNEQKVTMRLKVNTW